MRSAPAYVVVPTRDRADAVMRLLEALGVQTVPPDQFEVVVAVDGSRDDTVARLRNASLPFAVRVVELDGRGRAAACNAGVAQAGDGIIALLDDDMEPEPGWLAAHLRQHEDHVPRAVIGAAPTRLEAATPRAGRYLARRFDRHLAKLASAGIGSFRDVYTGNFSIPAETLRAAGGFDETFGRYGNEDGELAIRLAAAGVPIVFAEDAVAWQHQDKDLDAAFRDAVAKGGTAVHLARLHPEARRELAFGRRASIRRRTIRAVLALVDRVPGMTAGLLGLTRMLERLDPPGLDRWYALVLEHGYFRGVRETGRRPDTARATTDGSGAVP